MKLFREGANRKEGQTQLIDSCWDISPESNPKWNPGSASITFQFQKLQAPPLQGEYNYELRLEISDFGRILEALSESGLNDEVIISELSKHSNALLRLLLASSAKPTKPTIYSYPISKNSS